MKTLHNIMQKQQYSIITSFIILVVMACNHHKPENTSSKPVIQKPFAHVSVPIESFSVDPVVGATLCTQNGTKIYISAESLIDENGSILKEPCTVSIEQYHDMAEILSSGIPMSLKSGDVNPQGAFVSAGMFKLSGNSLNGKPIKIKKDKTIKVELASFVSDSGYSNYRLDLSNGNWIKTENDQRQVNSEWKRLKDKISAFNSKGPFADKHYFIFNTDALVDAYFKDNNTKIHAYYNHRRFPKALHSYGIQITDYPEDFQKYYTMACIRGVEYPSGAVVWKNSNGKDIIVKKNLKIRISGGKQIKTSYYSYNKITENDIAKLELIDSKNNVIATYSASPVMSIKHMLAYSSEDWKKKEKAIWAEIKKDEERLKFIAEFTRTINVSEFGIYNSDRLNKDSENKPVLANFSWPKNFKGANTIYYINTSKRFIINYSPQNATTIYIENDPQIQLITVSDHNQILEVTTSDLQKAYKANTKSVELQFKPSKQIKTIDELKAFLKLKC